MNLLAYTVKCLKMAASKMWFILDAAGKEQAIAAKDYISQGIQPELDELPEVGTDHEFPVSGKG